MAAALGFDVLVFSTVLLLKKFSVGTGTAGSPIRGDEEGGNSHSLSAVAADCLFGFSLTGPEILPVPSSFPPNSSSQYYRPLAH